jgi:hypothetical protein
MRVGGESRRENSDVKEEVKVYCPRVCPRMQRL